jgi:VanZ family protein
MGLIFYFSSRPSLPSLPESWIDLLAKKTVHVAEYAILAMLLWRALRSINFSPYLVSFAMAVLYAVSDEFHQSFVPGRTASPRDVAIDTLSTGATLVLLWWLWRRRLQ